MYAFVLVLGAVVTAAGFSLIASGVPINESDAGNTLILTGVIAAVGGLLLVGIGIAVRQLQRIEHALVPRAATRSSRPEAAAAVAATAQPTPPARIPFPPKPKAETRPPAEPTVNASPAPIVAEETAFERLRQKFPSLGRLDSATVVEETEISLSPKTPPRPEEYPVEAKTTTPPPAPTNGAEPAKTTQRLEVPARPTPPPERPTRTALFDAFWPKDMRRAKQAAEQPGSAAEPAPSVGPNGSAPAPQPPDYQQVSILKSGVVDGMAYTLYSDGSIEAQLPQGTMRFGSITDLRNHLERNA